MPVIRPYNHLLRFYWLFFISLFFLSSISRADSGWVEGILSAKGDHWIEVLDDGDFLHRFIPQWIGEGPANGGGFNEEMIEEIDLLIVGNRVRVNWMHDGFLRVLRTETLSPASPGGIFEGYLIKASNRWVDFQNIDERKTWRFYLPWKGGYPSEGGGYDRGVLQDLKKRNPTDPVLFLWEYRGRPTLISLYEKINQMTTPFWVGKTLPKPKEIHRVSSNQVADSNETKVPSGGSPFDMIVTESKNPFDQLNQGDKPPVSASPFDQLNSAPAGNPFEQMQSVPAKPAPKTGNPFDQMQSVPVNSSPKSGNPFEGIPLPNQSQSPFELIDKK